MHGPQTASGVELVSPPKYRLIAELGHGGMAAVFLAVAQGPAGFQKLVVLKQIRPNLAEDPEFLNMFLEEARLAARLSHPNIVQTNEIGQENGRYFIAMEYLEGQPLNRVLSRFGSRGKPLHLTMQARILVDVCAGLHHAHELCDYDGAPFGIVHRDVSPHNIFVTYHGQIKLVDFGIAKALDSAAETRSGVLKGKIAYIAPEQARGDRVDRRADLFSLGVMLWQAAAGRRMWQEVPEMTILHRLISGELPSLRAVNPDVPEAFVAIVAKALAHKRDDRYATAADLQADLERFLEARGQRITPSAIAVVVAKEFEVDRARVGAVIDEQLRARPSNPGQSLRAIEVSGRVPSVAMGQEPDSLTTPLVAQGSQVVRSPVTGGRARLRGLYWIALFLVLAGVATAALRFVRKGKTSVPTSSATTPTPLSENREQASLVFRAEPPTAKLYLDDVPLASNPHAQSMVKDGSTRTVRADAKGFVPKSVRVVIDQDKEVILHLDKMEPAAPHAAPAAVARPRVVAKPGPPSTAPAGTAPPVPPSAKPSDAARGYLSLDTYPWTHVSLGGRVLGQTPLVRVALPPGEHTLVLDNPDQNLRHTVVVTIVSGETTTRRLGLK